MLIVKILYNVTHFFAVDITACRPHSCGFPPVISYGTFTLDDGSLNFDSHASYFCDRGYEMNENAQNKLRCTENKLWGPFPAPVCVAKNCGPITCPSNGEFLKNVIVHSIQELQMLFLMYFIIGTTDARVACSLYVFTRPFSTLRVRNFKLLLITQEWLGLAT